jgi:Tol biopolymer transport system component
MFPNSLRLLLIPGVTLALSAPVSASRGITPEDYFAFEFINAPTLSPDGQQVAYVRTVINQQKNRRDSSIWLVATDGHTAPKRLTAEGFNSNSPRWSLDGSSLAFLSNRNSEITEGGLPGSGSRAQIWVLPMSGGEAQVVSHLKNGVESFQWSPEGKRLAAVSRTGPNDQITPATRKSDVRHYKHISYKFNDTGWYDDKRSHLWVIDCASGKETQITSGDDWNDTDPHWSPDGTRIAFVSDRTGEEYDGGFNKDVWVISAEGGPLTKISDHAFEDEQPRWSPDGKQLLFTGKTDRRQFPRLYLADAVGGSPSRLLVENLDLIPTGLQWCGQQEIRFAAGVKGQAQIFRVDVAKRQLGPITSGERTGPSVPSENQRSSIPPPRNAGPPARCFREHALCPAETRKPR